MTLKIFLDDFKDLRRLFRRSCSLTAVILIEDFHGLHQPKPVWILTRN